MSNEVTQNATAKGDVVEEHDVVSHPASLEEMRAKIFSRENKRPRSEVVGFFTVEIEIRQGTLGDVLDSVDEEGEHEGIIQVLLDNAYVPGTNTKVFGIEHREELRSMPMGKDFAAVGAAYRRLSQIDVNAAEKN